MSNETLFTIAAWLLTYLVHSTILLGLVWIVCRGLGSKHMALQELLWRGAMIGGLLTATVQTGFGVQPLSGVLDVSHSRQVAVRPAAARVDQSRVDHLVVPRVPPTAAPSPAQAANVNSPIPARTTQTPKTWWPALLLTLWLLGAGLGLVRLAVALLNLRTLLGRRRALSHGRLPAMVQRLAGAMGLRSSVKVSTSTEIMSPVAASFSRPEVLLPKIALLHLSIAQQEGLLAHELAHILRRDPLWILVYRLLETMLFIQPLNRVACRRLLELSECLSDDQAVSCTGKRLDLASCLVEVAEWITPARQPVLLASALPARSRIGTRIQRLLSAPRIETVRATWALPMVVAALAAVVLSLPSVSLDATGIAEAALSGPQRGGVSLKIQEPAESDQASAPAPEPSEQPPAHPAPLSSGSSDSDSSRIAEMLARIEELSAARERRAAEVAASIAIRSEELERRAAEKVAELTEQMRLGDEEQRRVAEQTARIAAEIGERMRLSEEEQRRFEEQSAVLTAELQALVERSLQEGADIDELAIREQIRELTERIREMRAELRPSREELHSLIEELRPRREELRQLRESLRPSREEVRQLIEELRPEREELRQLRESLRPSEEEMSALQELTRQLREELRISREEYERQSREMREQAREQARAAREQEQNRQREK
jgi:beta-lactamase regulating signal transducer with metallopeptidase domain